MKTENLFNKIAPLLNELQEASGQNYAPLLKKLGRFLNDPILSNVSEELTIGLNLEEFKKNALKPHGSMLSCSGIQWPDNPKEELGMKLLLIKSWMDDPGNAFDIALTFYISGNAERITFRALTNQLLIPFFGDLKNYISDNS